MCGLGGGELGGATTKVPKESSIFIGFLEPVNLVKDEQEPEAGL